MANVQGSRRSQHEYSAIQRWQDSISGGDLNPPETERPIDGKIMKITSTWRRMVAVGCLGAMSLGLTGCSVMSGACKSIRQQECLDEFMIGYRNSALAAKAWHRVKHCYKNKTYYNDFRSGFFDGYADVAAGGPGCVPAVAPTSYWGWRYQSRDGQAAVNAYFEGYPLGVKAAEQDGVGHWGNIHASVGRPVQPQPFVPAPIPTYSDRDREFDDRDDNNPFFPQPVPDNATGDGEEGIEPGIGEEDTDMELGDDPAGAIERALEDALEGDDSVQYRDVNGLPLGVNVGEKLVPRSSVNTGGASSAAEFEIADSRNASFDASGSVGDQPSSIERVFGAQEETQEESGDNTMSVSDELPFVFE